MTTSSDGKDGAEKYKSWSFEELKSECAKRKLIFNETDDKDALTTLLFKDDHKPPCWGKIYARLLFHTGMGYEEVAKRTIPQIEAILAESEENIAIKMGMAGIFGGAFDNPSPSSASGETPKLSEFFALTNAFNGI